MSRPRSETIGSLGRAPARANKSPTLPPPPPKDPEKSRLREWLHGAFFDNVGLKFLSMVLAITVFLLVNTDRDREISARVGVSYTLPDDKVLVSDRLDEVRITVKGPWQRLRKFDERELDRVNLDLRRAPTGDIPITPDMIHVPSGLTITSVSPRTVRVAFERRVDKLVEVSPQLVGRPQHGYVVADAKVVPATIKVHGAESTLAALSAVHTHEVSVEGRTESFTTETDVGPPDGVETAGSSHVIVQVTVEEALVTRKLPGIAVSMPAGWAATP
ncbi:MAG TPA: CdaR family protein, partial [Kofleriaceae bacterium]|nr:CdaR family protein [Kofleriaceae bacterium]